MAKTRIIGRLDIKGTNLIKGIHLEGLRVVGSPIDYAKKYYLEGIDELIFMDSVASLYERNNLSSIVSAAARDIFVPVTVGGGIRSIQDAEIILRSGADKIAINTAAVESPDLISSIAHRFGSQCMVLSIEAKQIDKDRWEVYTNNGRERTGIDVLEWAQHGVRLGAGEILLTSVDREGTRKGFDISLLSKVANSITVPVIASGGMGSSDHLITAVIDGGVGAVAIADVLHFNRLTLAEIRKSAIAAGLSVRDINIE